MTEKYDVELYKTQRSETVRYYTTGSSILWHIVVMGGHIKAINCHGWICRP